MRTKKVKSISPGLLIWILSISIFIISSDAYASSIQAQSPATIFAASCATCHGGRGLGGVTWVKNNPSDKRIAPKIAGKYAAYIKSMVRNGSSNGGMPAFGPEEITDAELNNLANWLQINPYGVPAPTAPGPVSNEVRLDILDADPWYSDGGLDNALDPGDDVRRVALGPSDYLKVVNTGRTWHTFTNSSLSKDSGFIGYAGNYKDTFGDLNQSNPGIGYYYADQTTGLATGCKRYLCKLHPYMQVEVCTSGYTPAGPSAVLGLTRAHKHPIGLPAVPGVGEVWVTAQSQEELGENTTTVIDNSVADMDGAYQVIDASNFAATPIRIPDVGNNPHNAWPGKDGAGNDVVLSADWHDNTVVLMDANYKSIINRKRSGAANAHIQVTPGAAERFYVTHMGGRSLQEVDVNKLALGQNPNVGGVIKGATGPHGLWTCDDGIHILTADTFGNSATLYNISLKTRVTAGSGGKSPLAPSIAGGIGGGCSRGFTNNALTADVSVYNINSASAGSETIVRNTAWTANPSNWLYKNAAGNIQLRNTTDDQSPGGVLQVRWVHLPIQTPVSPADATTHGRYMVTANKASFNVSVTALDPSTGLPTATYTFPAGLGAHGVTYGPKSVCSRDSNSNGDYTYPDEKCYYAYVTNTFEDYVSVYDLEKIEDGSMGAPGSALLAETVYVEGGAVAAVAALDPGVAGLCDAFGGGVLDCGGGTMGGGALFVSNLPIGVLCPDCRAGVHAGDVPLGRTTGESLASGCTTVPCTNSANDGGLPPANDGATSKYTYLKEEVWVDTDTVACALGANDCSGATVGPYGGDAAGPGTLNLKVELDLDPGINTGGQGIVVRPAATPWP